ncbi:MAG: Arylsulfatase [Verrucomicrobiota bacterium]|jgi:arylsulfatase A
MKHLLILASFLALCSAHPVWGAEATPNVLLIIADDQGFGDFGFTGNPLVLTPNLDRLAAESAVYRNFIVAPACSPTRAALLTGRDHLLTGVWGVPPRANLREDEVRMPAFFKATGYRTLHVGKLDSARVGKSQPTAFGWEDYLCGSGYEHRDPMMWKPKNSERGQGWTADLWTEHTLRYIREHRERPWFISLAYIIPHMPWVCDDKYSAPFVAQGCSANLAACYGSIAQMDAGIGRLLDALRETGQDERTIVVFLSDNGPSSPESKKLSPEALAGDADWKQRNVANLRGQKAQVWENGIRVPLLMRWPGRIAPGERTQLAGVEDVLPTLLDLAKIDASATPHLPFSGVSLLASLEDASAGTKRPDLFRMTIAGPGAPASDIATAADRLFEDHHLTLRGPRFKYQALPGGKCALYDIQADPGERTDVQEQFPDIATRMALDCNHRWEMIVQSGRAFNPPPPGEPAASKENP